jgi:hypothetical protein
VSPEVIRIDLREFGPEKEDLRRVIHLQQ